MPRSKTPTLTWSNAESIYMLLSTANSSASSFEPGPVGETRWQAWLEAQDSLNALVFQGQSGHLNLQKEARSRGGKYWYAYFYTGGTILKRYLGATNKLTFARLESLVGELTAGRANLAEKTLAASTSPHPDFLPASPTPTSSQKIIPGAEKLKHFAASGSSQLLISGQILLVTKLLPPVLPPSMVPRARLLDELKAAVAKPLTLVCATAGWGKTTFLAEWAKTANTPVQPFPVGWLSLDKLDNDLNLFWASVISALQRVVPDLGKTALRMLCAAQPAAITAILATLLNELTVLETEVNRPSPVILVLDDYQVIEEASIHESLVFLLEHMPANLRVVIASRQDPPFPLLRWRVKGLLAEIRAEKLSFNPEETAFFLQNNGELSLSPEEVATLGNRTQGWVAGLQLVALSLEKQSQSAKSRWIDNFNGNNRYLLDYMEDEILSHQPETIQQFLFNTAILNRLNAQVCQAVSGEVNSQELLNSLERNNLFVIPLDDQRQWYRYHDLFREVLLARLQMNRPELVEELHTRAAHWYAEHHEPREAIAHAFAASNFALTAMLVEQTAKQFWLSGQQQAVFNWVELWPDETLKQYALLALEAARNMVHAHYAAIQAVYVKVYDQVAQLISRLEKGLSKADEGKATTDAKIQPAAEMSVIRRRIQLLRAYMAARTHLNNDDAAGLKQLLENVQEFGEDEDLNWRLVSVSLSFWRTESVERRGSIMIPQLLELKDQAIQEGNNSALVTLHNRLAFVFFGAGQEYRAVQETLDGLALLQRTGELSINEAYFHYFYSGFLNDRYRLDESRQELQEAIRIAHLWQWIDLLVVSYFTLAQLEILQNNLIDADQALQKAEELAQKESYANFSEWIIGIRVRYWLANGEINRARQWAENIEFLPQTWHQNQFEALYAQVKVFLELGHYRRAVEILEAFNPVLNRPNEDISRTIPYLGILFLALHLAGKREQAQSVAGNLFAFTQPEEKMWVYLSNGALMRQALQSLLDASKTGNTIAGKGPEFPRAYVEGLVEAFDHYEMSGNLPATSNSRASSMPGESGTTLLPPQSQPFTEEDFPTGSGEALSPQEQRVLRLLVSDLTYGEIAEELIVSLNTIKTQVRSIYRKLGVNRRSELVKLVQTR